MLVHSFDRFYVCKKFILHTISDLKFSTINVNDTGNSLQEKNGCSVEVKQYISDITVYCRRIIPFVHYYRGQISSFNHTLYNILTKEISIILL